MQRNKTRFNSIADSIFGRSHSPGRLLLHFSHEVSVHRIALAEFRMESGHHMTALLNQHRVVLV